MRSILLLPALSLLLAAEAPLSVDAPIVRVRLHPDEAWVTRSGKVNLPASGIHKLRFGSLPPGLRIEDLQVSAKGPAGTRLGDLAVSSDVRTVTETPEWKKLEAERDAQREKRDTLEAQGEAAQQELSFLKGLQAAHDKELSARMTYGTPNAPAIVELGKGLQARMADILAGERKRKRDLTKLAKEEARVDAEMRKRASEQQTAPSIATLELTTPGAASVNVELSYRTRAARWKPMYEARLSEDRKKLNLVLYAAITQTSGEAWEDVGLEISNARPSRSLNVPMFTAGQEIGWHKEEPAKLVAEEYSRARADKEMAKEAEMRSQVMSNIMAEVPPPPPPAPMEAAESTASVIEEASGLAATFSVDGLKEVPSDGEPHRFKVVVKEVDPEMVLFTSPRMDPTAFLIARFAAPGGLPLFPNSPVVRYAGNQRLGEAPLAVPTAGQSFSLGFGPFKSLRASFRHVDSKLEQVGTFSKDRQWTLRERLEISNDSAEDLTVEVQDRILKSTSDQVKINLLSDFTPGWVESTPGVRTWKLKLPAKGQTQIQMPVTIRVPKDGIVTGLEDLHLPLE